MKIVKTVFFTVFLIFANIYAVLAGDGAPAPNFGPPLEPPAAPIDDNLFVLMVAALIIGFVVVYKNKIKKASV